MIDISILREYYKDDNVFMTQHASERCRQRGIRKKDIKNAVFSGEIIEQYPEDFPFPSCLICGATIGEKTIHVVMSNEESMSRIITAYFPDLEKWEVNFRIRRG